MRILNHSECFSHVNYVIMLSNSWRSTFPLPIARQGFARPIINLPTCHTGQITTIHSTTILRGEGAIDLFTTTSYHSHYHSATYKHYVQHVVYAIIVGGVSADDRCHPQYPLLFQHQFARVCSLTQQTQTHTPLNTVRTSKHHKQY